MVGKEGKIEGRRSEKKSAKDEGGRRSPEGGSKRESEGGKSVKKVD